MSYHYKRSTKAEINLNKLSKKDLEEIMPHLDLQNRRKAEIIHTSAVLADKYAERFFKVVEKFRGSKALSTLIKRLNEGSTDENCDLARDQLTAVFSVMYELGMITIIEKADCDRYINRYDEAYLIVHNKQESVERQIFFNKVKENGNVLIKDIPQKDIKNKLISCMSNRDMTKVTVKDFIKYTREVGNISKLKFTNEFIIELIYFFENMGFNVDEWRSVI